MVIFSLCKHKRLDQQLTAKCNLAHFYVIKGYFQPTVKTMDEDFTENNETHGTLFFNRHGRTRTSLKINR